eukprot:m.137298 g.137298  ORF g.137298 m.137298 type:complete len:674 (-) comp16051_c0_seq5:807-2828(-)
MADPEIEAAKSTLQEIIGPENNHLLERLLDLIDRARREKEGELNGKLVNRLEETNRLLKQIERLQGEHKEETDRLHGDNSRLSVRLEDMYIANADLLADNFAMQLQIGQYESVTRSHSLTFTKANMKEKAESEQKPLCDLLPRVDAADMGYFPPLRRQIATLGADRQSATMQFEGAAPVCVWDAAWKKRDVTELTLQTAIQDMEGLINKLSKKLTWDFRIETLPTINSLKPDGHGRHSTDSTFRTSLPHLGVVVEIKTAANLKDGIAQAKMYCHRVLSHDPSRSHMYAVITDLVTCYLLRVDASLVKQLKSAPKAQTGTILQASVPWFDTRTNTAPGIALFEALGRLPPKELGMSPLNAIQSPFKDFKFLGKGGSALVYAYSTQGSEKVLKVLNKKSHFEQEKLCLNALASLPRGDDDRKDPSEAAAAGVSGRALRSHTRASPQATESPYRIHFPQMMAEFEFTEAHFVMRPRAQRLNHLRIQPRHVFELMEFLQWLHNHDWLHGDLSTNNIMLVNRDWRQADPPQATQPASGTAHAPQPVFDSRKSCVIVVDWGSAVLKQDAHTLETITGTRWTMSQKTLACLIDERKRAAYVYTEEDDLESAVKSLLLILSPTLARCIKTLSAKGSSDRILLSCWNKVLPEEVMQMCKNRQYDIATWITSNDRLLLLEASD